MRKTIKQLLVVTTAVVLICAAGCSPRKGSEELAAHLLKVSELHALYAEAYAAGYRDAALKDGRPEKEIDCVVSKVTPELVLPALADAYSIELSDNELRQAISFFGSEAGKAYLQSERNVLRELRGTPTVQVPDLSAPEVERINAFAETRVGEFIMTPHSKLAESAKEKVRPLFSAVSGQCRNPR